MGPQKYVFERRSPAWQVGADKIMLEIDLDKQTRGKVSALKAGPSIRALARLRPPTTVHE